MVNPSWRKEDCEHYYSYYTWLSAHGLVSMPCCSKGCSDCVDCEYYEVKKENGF